MDTIENAVLSFVKYIGMGWDVELAFDVAYDAVYDVVKAEEFLNMCQMAVSK